MYRRRIVPEKIEVSPRQRVFWNLFDSYAESESSRSKKIHSKSKGITQFYFCKNPLFYWDLILLKPTISPDNLNLNWSLLKFDAFSNIYERKYACFYLNNRPYYAEYPTPLGMTHQGLFPDTQPGLKIQGNVCWDSTIRSNIFDPMVLEDLLWGLRAKREDIEWLSETASFQPSKVIRQDDNGHIYEVAEFESLLEARWRVEELEKLTHKQTFWAEPIQPS
jgi:hypothetical protein